jgi:hypothetical protein
MLLFYEPSTMVDGKRVRSPNWYSILQECKRNDKENGQYDYLAALHFWETSARYDYETDTLVIHDLERFERGNTCFQDGLGKTIVATDIHHLMSAAAALVGKSVLPAREHERAVRNCVPELSYALPRLLAMWRGNQAKRLEKRGDVREAMRVHRQTLHFVEQFARGNGMADVLFRSIGRRNAASSIRKLAQEHGDLFPSVDQRELTAIIHMEVLNARLYRIAEGKIYKTRPTGSTAVLNSTVAGYVLPESALTLLAIVILGVATARVFGVSTPPTIGALGAIVTMSAALSISFVVFGFAPAEIVNEEQQAWSFTLLIVCSPILLLAIGAWFWFRRSRFRWGLRSLFLLMIAIGLALAAWRVIDPKQEAFDTMPFRLSVPDVRMSQLEKQLSVELTYRTLYQHPWIHALLQWAAYHGPISAVLFWTVLATVFTGMKLRRNYDVDDRPVAMRDQIANLLSSTSRPAAAIGLVVLCAYFILAVSAVRDFDAKFQWRMAELRHAEAYWSQLELEMEHAQADDQQMKRLSKSVDAEMERLER